MHAVLHVGASGLVGQQVVRRLLGDPRVGRVVAPARRALGIEHPRLLVPVVSFDALPQEAPWWQVDAVICTLGTTLAQAGSRDAFRRVDYAYPLAVARLAHAHGARNFALNSAMGADPASRVFYSRVKGELEEALAHIGFEALTLVRPGLIDGERVERRTGEALALAVSRMLRPALPRAWRPSRAGRIADALVEAALAPRPGVTTVEAAALA